MYVIMCGHLVTRSLLSARRYEMLSVLLPTAHAVWKEAECEEELKKEVKSFQHSVADILKKAPWW